MRWRVVSETEELALNARDTVMEETPATRATSFMVGVLFFVIR